MTPDEHDAIMQEVRALLRSSMDELKAYVSGRFDHIDQLDAKILARLDSLEAAIEQFTVYCQRIAVMIEAERRRWEQEDEHW